MQGYNHSICLMQYSIMQYDVNLKNNYRVWGCEGSSICFKEKTFTYVRDIGVSSWLEFFGLRIGLFPEFSGLSLGFRRLG